jgi:hypothetical protein
MDIIYFIGSMDISQITTGTHNLMSHEIFGTTNYPVYASDQDKNQIFIEE